jgi:hypothetical protein
MLQVHTLRLCNTRCFSTTTMVARKRLNVTWYVHCLSYFSIYSLITFTPHFLEIPYGWIKLLHTVLVPHFKCTDSATLTYKTIYAFRKEHTRVLVPLKPRFSHTLYTRLHLRPIKLHYLFVLVLGSRRTAAPKGPTVDSPGSRRMKTGKWWNENWEGKTYRFHIEGSSSPKRLLDPSWRDRYVVPKCL